MEQMTPGGKFWALNYTTEATLDVRFSWQKKAAQIVTKEGMKEHKETIMFTCSSA